MKWKGPWFSDEEIHWDKSSEMVWIQGKSRHLFTDEPEPKFSIEFKPYDWEVEKYDL